MDTPTVSLILTVIGDDRLGLVERLASAISRHDGNWLESSMSHLSGKFAGIVSIELPPEKIAPLEAELARLEEKGKSKDKEARARAGLEVRKAALAKAIEGVDVDELEQVWKTFVAAIPEPKKE